MELINIVKIYKYMVNQITNVMGVLYFLLTMGSLGMVDDVIPKEYKKYLDYASKVLVAGGFYFVGKDVTHGANKKVEDVPEKPEDKV